MAVTSTSAAASGGSSPLPRLDSRPVAQDRSPAVLVLGGLLRFDVSVLVFRFALASFNCSKS